MDQSNNFDAKIVECVEDFYMENFFKSNDSEKYLLTLSKDLMELLSNCSFCLTKWLSNSKIIMMSLPQSELSPKFNNFNERIIERVFRILWDINNDMVKLNLIAKGFSDTKRGVLSFYLQSVGFFESLFARNKVTDSRFVEEEIKLGRFTS